MTEQFDLGHPAMNVAVQAYVGPWQTLSEENRLLAVAALAAFVICYETSKAGEKEALNYLRRETAGLLPFIREDWFDAPLDD